MMASMPKSVTFVLKIFKCLNDGLGVCVLNVNEASVIDSGSFSLISDKPCATTSLTETSVI
jgi:hypothetical protein